jgi:prepilin-type N-terminal cleavage/methylation domain-containing protein
MQIKRNLTKGFTLVEIMIVVAIIGLLAAIAIPNFVRARQTSQKNACINNLRQLDGAIQQYALENNVAAGGTVTLDNVAPYLGRGDVTAGTQLDGIVYCPAAGTDKVFANSYAVTTTSEPPTCKKVTDGTHALPTNK